MSALGGVDLVLARFSADAVRAALRMLLTNIGFFVTGCGRVLLRRRTTGEEIARGKV